MQSSNKVDTSTEPPSPVDAQRSKILASVPKESLGCFFVTPSEKPKHARAKFDPRRRDEVALVRRKGACLRCRLLKKKCDGNDPCSTCLKLAAWIPTLYEKKVLQFSECIRTSLTSINIYEHEALPPPNNRLALQYKAIQFASSLPTLSRSLIISSNQLSHLVTWLNSLALGNTDSSTAASSSSSTTFPSDLIRCPAGDYPTIQQVLSHLSYSEMLGIGYMAGHTWLAKIDQRMMPRPLAASSRDELVVLFIFIFNALSAVSHYGIKDRAKYPYLSPDIKEEEDPQENTLYNAMQEHIVCTLGHYLAFLGSKLDLGLTESTEKLLVGAKPEYWTSVDPWDEVDGFKIWGMGLRLLIGACVSKAADPLTKSPN